MNPNQNKYHRIENAAMFGMFALFILIFILTPSHAESGFSLALNDFLDKYLFGNGYYKPDAYPFASKVTNSFSVVLAVATGIFVGIACRNGFTRPPVSRLKIFLMLTLFTVLMLFFLHESIYPQEFKKPSGRNFGLTASFHNSPVSFLFLMMCKGGCIYIWFRIMIPFTLYALRKIRNGTKVV